MAEKTTLKVDGMSCNHCKMRVEKALQALDGVHEAVVDLEAGTAEVNYDESKVSQPRRTHRGRRSCRLQG